MNNYTESKTFCFMPFTSVMVDVNKTLKYCCITNDSDSTIGITGVTTLMQAFNSPHMIDVRRKMVNGEKVSECERCYYQEEVLKNNSPRHHVATEYQEEKYHNMVKEIIENDFIAKESPVYLDLRLGNLCNLKCRMCNPWSSSQIAKEHFNLYDNEPRYKEFWNINVGPNITYLKEKDEWYESNFLWDEIESFIPNLRKVYMTGGEPTLVQGNFKFMEKCIETGYNDKITLSFSCNCTNINSKFLNLLKQFKSVVINASLDGVGKTTEYIRYPSNWDIQVKNLTLLAELPNVELVVTPTLTLYNVLECDKIIEFSKQFGIDNNKRIQMDYLQADDLVFSANILPLEFREAAAKRVEKWVDDEWVNSSDLTKNAIVRLLAILQEETKDNYKACMNDFKMLTEVYDTSREQSFKETFPELSEIVYEITRI